MFRFHVPEGTQLIHDTLRIGVGDITRERGLIDGDPLRSAPLGVGLWVFVRDHPELDRRLRARTGDRFTIAGYRVRVVAIDLDSVTLELVAERTASPAVALVRSC